MKIVTLTLSPAFDIHCRAESLNLLGESLVERISQDAGGKGINISAALLPFIGSDVHILLPEGGKDEFMSALKDKGLNKVYPYLCKGDVRKNITVHTKDGETRISFKADKQHTSLADGIFDSFKDLKEGDVFALAGSVPDGISVDHLAKRMRELSQRGVFTVIDSKSFSPKDLKIAAPSLIKPNEEEIISLSSDMGYDRSFDMLTLAKNLSRDLSVSVMLTLGKGGARLFTKDGDYKATPPKIEPISTVGAGDSSIAGFIYGKSLSLPDEECLRYAVSFGTAACLEEGTAPPRAECILEILRCVT